MKCSSCGCELEEGAKFCTECGAWQRKASRRGPEKKSSSKIPIIILAVLICILACAGGYMISEKMLADEPAEETEIELEQEETEPETEPETESVEAETEAETTAETEAETTAEETTAEETEAADNGMADGSEIGLASEWKYADHSKINSGKAIYRKSTAANRKNITVCVNAGHGTSGGSSVKTLCHPDGTAKVTSGTTSAGATEAVAVSGGMTFADGTAEHKVTLAMALILRDKLLAKGYDVLMIRETEDVQLDNVARTVIANNMADCHIALHWDSTESDKGAFYMSVPSNESYRAMEPVASHWKEHNRLGEALIEGLKSAGVKIFSGGSMEMDLTQTSYSTVPSIDIELGDKTSDHSNAGLSKLADGLAAGIDRFFVE